MNRPLTAITDPVADPAAIVSITGAGAVTAPVKLAYGMGQLVEGVSTTVIATFLFFFYTAVLGLSGSLVGAAAAASLIADAIADPLLGSWSDNTRSLWGRRIPFMAIGGPVVALGLGLAFSPPGGGSPLVLFIWLTAISVVLRFAISVFNVPFIALGAEISHDYTERSGVVASRIVFGIVGSLVAVILGYSVFLTGPGGLLRAANYRPFAWVAAGLVTVGGAVCVIGVGRFAARLPVTPADPLAMHRRFLGEVIEIFSNPSFRVLFATSVLLFVAQGVATTLGVHMNVFVWKMSSSQIQVTTLGYFAGLLVGVPVAPLLVRRMEKRTVLILGLLALCVAQGGLSGLRALGILTLSGGAAVLPLSINLFFAGVGVTCGGISVGSMMADAADEHDFLFAKRREGLYFSGLGFATKAATGLGALLGGIALDAIRFPRHVTGHTPSVHVAPETLTNLAIVSGPLVAIVSVVATLILIFYRIDRRRHAVVVEALQARRLAAV
jgi:glycoside/pentoside/hexuronide:cation symporter, GPH family